MTIPEPRPFIASRGNDIDPWPRYITSAAGAWLFLSGLFWTHLVGQRANALIVGPLMLIVAIVAIGTPKVRFANAVLALWLFFSSVFLPVYRYTEWNNVIVAVVVFVFSLVPSGHSGPFSRPVPKL